MTLLTMGSRGDVQPIVALGLGLAAAGHTVSLAAQVEFEPLVRAYGLDFRPVTGNVREVAESVEAREALHRGGLKSLRFLARRLEPLMVQYALEAREACRDAEVIGASVLNLTVGHSLAESMGVPWFAAYPVPIVRTRAFPDPALPPGPTWLPGWNWLSHWLAERLLWGLMKRPFQAARTRALDLPPYPRHGPIARIRSEAPPLVVGVSRFVLPLPTDWPPTWDITGYWFLDAPRDWTPPPALESFLDAGPPPVYAGFGSMTGPDPGRDARILLDAAESVGARLVLSRGWAGLHAEDLPPWAVAVGDVPHDWLFPRMAAIVHHGGAGTTAAAVRAGIPSIPVPFFADQPFWAWRLRAVGVAPPPIPYRCLTAARLSDALRAALGDDGLRQRARILGDSVRSEDGIGRAVAHLERCWRPKMVTATVFPGGSGGPPRGPAADW